MEEMNSQWCPNFCATTHFQLSIIFSGLSAIRGNQFAFLFLHLAFAAFSPFFLSAAMSLRAGARLVSRPPSPSIAGINVFSLLLWPFLRRLLQALTHRHHTGNSGPRRPPLQSPTKQVTVVVHRLSRPSIRRRGPLPRPSRTSCTTPLNSLARLRSVMC